VTRSGTMVDVPQPLGADEETLLLGWLAYFRDAVRRKAAGLSPEQLIRQSTPPSSLSLLGIVRHLSEMERVYVHFALRGGELELRYCAHDPEADIERLKTVDCDPSIAAWADDCQSSDALLRAWDLDAVTPGNGLTVRWNVMKLLGEYARHAGHADLLRESIDGETGE
jgi:Protein of unknown function (DUF664)